ncbi:MAG TPA: ABC transporter permease [Pyrinomonadaceae bacterium]|nr:ABC transporter permease [Pyrinomonadaceae bacterium]
MQNLLQDTRYGLRMLVKRPGFTIVAVLTLALGIAANTAIFSVVNAVLLKPLPFPKSEQLVDLAETFKPDGWGTASVPTLEDWKSQNTVFSGISAFSFTSFNLQRNSDLPQRVPGLSVSANYFDVLGVKPVLGRSFLPEEDTAGRDRVVVLSSELWRSTFNSDPQILNTTIPVNGQQYTVIGVMPPELSSLYRTVQMWSPLVFPEKDRQDRGNHKYFVIGRIKDGVTLAQAREQMNAVAQRLEEQYHNGRGIRLMQIQELWVAGVRPALILMMVAVGFVLLIACTNVANLLLARATVRQREISIRIALGAGRLRLIQQFLSEGLLLSVIGGAFGVGLAWLGMDMLGKIAFPFLPRAQEIGIDSRVLLFTLFVSILTSVIFGLVPALQTGRTDIQDVLKEGSNSISAGLAAGWLRQALVVVEIAAAFVLLIGAGLMIRSVMYMKQVEPGFKAQNLLTAKLSLPREKYADAESTIRFYNQLLTRVEALPGVEAAAVISHLPVEEQGFNGNVTVEGKTYPPNESPLVEYRMVSRDYLKAANIPLLRGRFFTDQDRADSPPVVVINDSMAKKVWPGEDPIGKRVGDEVKATVIGVVGDVKNYGLLRKPVAEMYAPYTMKDFWPDMLWNMRIMVRANADDTNLAAAVRREVQSVDPAQPLYAVQSMTVVLENTVKDKSLNMTLLVVFAGLSLLLAVIGVYGVMSYSVAQHTREIGIRMALGARPSSILKLILGRGMFLIVIGVAIGLLASFGLTRFISTMLFGVTPTDPLTFVVIVLLLALVALLACLVPAQRAMRVNPIVVLRYE